MTRETEYVYVLCLIICQLRPPSVPKVLDTIHTSTTMHVTNTLTRWRALGIEDNKNYRLLRVKNVSALYSVNLRSPSLFMCGSVRSVREVWYRLQKASSRLWPHTSLARDVTDIATARTRESSTKCTKREVVETERSCLAGTWIKAYSWLILF